jgi:iron-sulfur cluster repair protein YtfE (RIC family)
MGEAQPSLVRARILQDHGALRAKLEQLQRLAIEADGGSNAAAERAVKLTRALFEELADHLDIEEQVLVPMLREVDAWGELRASELVRHHETQWQELKALRSRADGSSMLAAAAELAALVVELRRDMLDEDRDVLAADVLRDDVLGIDVEDG